MKKENGNVGRRHFLTSLLVCSVVGWWLFDATSTDAAARVGAFRITLKCDWRDATGGRQGSKTVQLQLKVNAASTAGIPQFYELDAVPTVRFEVTAATSGDAIRVSHRAVALPGTPCQAFDPSSIVIQKGASAPTFCYRIGDVDVHIRLTGLAAGELDQSGAAVPPATQRTRPRAVTCKTCGGSGTCNACKGQGAFDCNVCWGSGNCVRCSGSGNCHVCHGKGRSAYGGACSWCYGSGDCQGCRGSGKCSACVGKGKTKCSPCRGSGKCYICGGRGKIR